MAQGLESLPPWLQAVATVVTAIVLPTAGIIAYRVKKPEGAQQGMVTATYANAGSDTAKLLESMQRLEKFEEMAVGLLEEIRDNQRAAVERSHSVDIQMVNILGRLDRLLDKGR